MSNRDLLRDPVWRAGELGLALPDTVHAVSVALPRWRDVVGYEEKWPGVVTRLKGGYPRFVIHPLVQELAVRIAGDRPALPFPSIAAAQLCVEFIQRRCGEQAEIVPGKGVFAVVTSPAGHDELKAFWQHTGLIVSTRQAEAALAGQSSGRDDGVVRQSLRRQLANLYDCGEDDVFLYPTGIASVFAALRAVITRTPGVPTVQVGFPYVDTLKLQEKFGTGTTLLHDLDHACDGVTDLLRQGPLAGCFTEIPGNPLLGSTDLRRITPILHEHRVPLVVDDVVATPFNVDVSGHADLIATSLTKYFVGSGDTMGGALICNPRSPLYGELRPIVAALHEELLFARDAAVIEANVGSFSARMRRHNAGGLFIAERLRRHPLVEQVWYPKWVHSEAYEAIRRPEGGWGGLVTFLPKEADTRSPMIYDNLAFCKGPSLGTVFTLACPFTLLAHYTELDWAESCGVPRNLIRLSIGLEEPGELWRRLESAIAKGCQGGDG